MRRQIIHLDIQDASPAQQCWLDLERLAQMDVTSENATHPLGEH